MPSPALSILLRVVLIALWLPTHALAQAMPEKPMPKHPGEARRCLTAAHGLGGFDPVSYQTGGPREGDPERFVDHEGVRYLFESDTSRDAFLADPERYLPRYGGWCAMSLALGSFTCPDYENFQIEDGQLLLFETTVFTNGRTLWNQDPGGNRTRADTHYRQQRAP